MKPSRKTKTTTTNSSSSSSSPRKKKTKTKPRKHKFISLLHDHSTEVITPQQQQLNLFPLHPENFYEREENVTDLFHTTDTTPTNLNFGFEWTAPECCVSISSSSSEEFFSPTILPSSSSPPDHPENYYLERTALRQRQERDPNEEKWVSYSEVVKKEEEEEDDNEEMDDCCVPKQNLNKIKKNRLLLKLDYQQILNAWSDKGTFIYVDGQSPPSPQVVPDILDDAMAHDSTTTATDVSLWKVPDNGSSVSIDGEGEGWKMRLREASVLRYKEKRQNRLFSKRIRYEVRKLNAEKRPRMKGRFVKRS